MSSYLGFQPTKNPNYYFISYNNEDALRVGPIAQAMCDSGIHLWYDHGIEYGDDWETVITDKIQNAQAVILFFTQGILQKSNSYVQKEYRIATQFFDKKVYVVLLDQISKDDVPTDKIAWWMDINQKQCITGYDYFDTDVLIKDIASTLALHSFQDAANPPSAQNPRPSDKAVNKTPKPQARKPKRRRTGCLIAVIAVILSVVLIAGVAVIGLVAATTMIGDALLNESSFLAIIADNLMDLWESDPYEPMPEYPEETQPTYESFEQETENIIQFPEGSEEQTTVEPARPGVTYTVTTHCSLEQSETVFDNVYTKLDEQPYAPGEQVTLSANTPSGYNFEGWFVAWSDTLISNELTYSFTMGEQNLEIEARFSAYTVSTTINHEHAGTYTKLDGKKVEIGQTVTLSAQPRPGYNFEGWYYTWSDDLFSKDPDCTFTMEAKDVNLEARFNYYTLSTYADTYSGLAGTYTEYMEEKISVGEQVTLEATVNHGYVFEGWYSDGRLVSPDLTYTFLMPAESVAYTAVYKCYRLSVGPNNTYFGEAGTATQFENRVVAEGDRVTLEAIVNDGFNFEGWYAGEILLSKDLTFTYTMPAEDVWIEARFNYHTVSVYFPTYAGTCEPNYDGQRVSAGKEVTLTATMNPGYEFVGWQVNGHVYYDLTYTFIMPDDNYHIEVLFNEKTATN